MNNAFNCIVSLLYSLACTVRLPATAMSVKNIFSSATPFLIFLKVLGLFPLKFSAFKSFNIDVIGILATFSTIIVFVIVLGCQLTNLNTLKSSSKILRNVWNIVSVNGLILQAFMIIYQLCKIKTVSSILIAIDDIDLKVC